MLNLKKDLVSPNIWSIPHYIISVNRKSQNTVVVHVGLPPEVPGDVRGQLEVTFPSLLWDCSTPPPAPRLSVLLKWWGEKSQGSIFR